MRDMKAFMQGNAAQQETTEAVVSKRFKDEKGEPIPFVFRGMDRKVDKEIKKSCTSRKKVSGTYVDVTDQEAYMEKFTAASIEFPDLKNADLQKSYGVMGEVDLLRKLLVLPGEFNLALQEAQKVNGYDKSFADLVEEAKN